MSGVNSTLNLVRMADRMSVQQLQKSMQDGTLPGWIAVPRIAELNKMGQKAKLDAAAAQPKPPTVDQQVMQQAAQEEMGGVDQLPVQTPAMAGGGIVAFADGGETDEDVDEAGWSKEERDIMSSLRQRMSDTINSEPTGMSYSDVAGGQLRAGKSAGTYKGITGDHKYKDLIQSEAKKVGLDPEYALKIAMIESGGLKNPEAVRSKAGAIGIMQLMPATAKSLGVENPEDPAQNIRGGVGMLKRLVDKYGDYELAGAAYNAGEGRVDRALRAGKLGGLPEETQGYIGKIRGMAEGGVTTTDPVTGEVYTSGGDQPGYFADLGDILPRLKRATGYGKMLPESERGWAPEPAKAAEKPATPVPTTQTNKPVVVPPVPKEGKVENTDNFTDTELGRPDYRSALYDRINKMIDESKSSRESDKYMSLMAAGLGMMGGTSPYAAANIGQGAMQGIQAQLAAQKQQGEQEKAITSGLLGLTRADLYEKSRLDQLKEAAIKRGDINTAKKIDQQLQRDKIQAAGNLYQLKQAEQIRKTAKDWEASQDNMLLQKDLGSQMKDWRNNAELMGKYNLAKKRWIAENMGMGDTDGVQTADSLLQ